ncbi:MAG: ribosome recycling factor [Bacilli bacterium]|jgi:ribosome recycling factor
MPDSIIKNGEDRMAKAIESMKTEFALIRAGRANPTVLNRVRISYYGVDTPLNQVASISTPEAQQLLIKPYDKSILKDIEKAILTADLNLTPLNDGVVIRINFPALTEEKRRDLVKEVKKLGENCKIAIRNIRRDINDQLKKLEKDSLISEDELKRKNDEVQKITDKQIENVDKEVKEKEDSIMEI